MSDTPPATLLDITRYGPWCLIAGASEGIGAAFAEYLARQGFSLVLVARRREPLEEFAASLHQRYGAAVRTVSTDLSTADAVDVVAGCCLDIEIGLLIYNAGARPHMTEFLDLPEQEALATTYLNVVGQTAFAARFGAPMRRRGRGGIILLGSLAAASGLGRLATYAASKAYTQIFAEGLWYELAPHGVDVLAVMATTTRTPAVVRMGMPLDDPEYPSMEPEQLVMETFEALGKGPVHHAGGSEATARAIQAMDRKEAVRMVSKGMERAVPIGQSRSNAS